eukprot:c20502_g1_i1.p1 GENE.c20502_g1_i1~~c20502_g1_i1.p1  ORF type:complete len:122 (-),score=13.35 c20502_g1_i1:30-395(-)
MGGTKRTMSAEDNPLSMIDQATGERMPIPVSFVLMSASKQVEQACKRENFNFLVCKRESNHPDRCVDQGRAVQSCVHSVLKQAQNKCFKPFSDYCDCMAQNYNKFEKCRESQAKFDACYGK